MDFRILTGDVLEFRLLLSFLQREFCKTQSNSKEVSAAGSVQLSITAQIMRK
ncbi:hypothetical protein ES319_A01G068900v1 [Gossypium barbadense]|uniref:Uncharacterized protein n=2 Tax=Gossypium TaxID=3633 RepID=A0A5J5WWP7_GOSBA|nr:hypothetical protein ES319_A01G068900v1 [Gossypium barbadense]TYH30207.1 hypothetical protein ES288_A01G075900v1 [Gossypium darwinii]